MMGRKILIVFSLWGACGTFFSSCMKAYIKNVGGDSEQVYSKIYFTDMNMAWGSTLDALKSSPLDISNQESGYIQTKWLDNTDQKNFFEPFGGAKAFLKAQYRFKISASKGFFSGKPSIKVTVIKEQMVQQDVLEGWRFVPTDGIEESTLLYRIGRLILIRSKIAKLESDQTQRVLEDSTEGSFSEEEGI